MAMEGVGESALDVLSRAATMLQEQSPIHTTNDEPPKSSIHNKQLPTIKWRRDRRTRPEYTRKLDLPKLSSNGRESPPSSRLDQSDDDNSLDHSTSQSNGDAPLDMSVRHRGLPPSYNQAISDPMFRSNYKSAVQNRSDVTIPTPNAQTSLASTNGSTHNNISRDELPSGISMCDPIIDEHFRRSLGKTYMTVFNNNNNNNTNNTTQTPTSMTTNNRTSPPLVSVVSPATNTNNDKSDAINDITNNQTTKKITIINTSTTVSDLMSDGAGLSVDDHFAKALGDTWLKLNNKKDNNNTESDLKSPAAAAAAATTSAVVENSNNMVTI